MDWIALTFLALWCFLGLSLMHILALDFKVEKIVFVCAAIAGVIAVVSLVMGGLLPAFQDIGIKDGPPTFEGIVSEFRITSGDGQYSGTMVVDGQRVDFTARELPVINVGYEYKIWMNGERLLKYEEVGL